MADVLNDDDDISLGIAPHDHAPDGAKCCCEICQRQMSEKEQKEAANDHLKGICSEDSSSSV